MKTDTREVNYDIVTKAVLELEAAITLEFYPSDWADGFPLMVTMRNKNPEETLTSYVGRDDIRPLAEALTAIADGYDAGAYQRDRDSDNAQS